MLSQQKSKKRIKRWLNVLVQRVFFVDRDLKEDASFESLEAEVKEKYKKMEKKRKFCGTKPLEQAGNWKSSPLN